MIQTTIQIHSSLSKAIWKFPHACFTILALLFLLAPVAWAQDNATIKGTVTDASGAVVPMPTHPHQRRDWPDERNYLKLRRRLSLRQRRHRHLHADATATGFQKYTKTGIVVNVAATLEEDAVQAVGSADTNRHRCRQTPCKCRRRPAKSAL